MPVPSSSESPCAVCASPMDSRAPATSTGRYSVAPLATRLQADKTSRKHQHTTARAQLASSAVPYRVCMLSKPQGQAASFEEDGGMTND